MTLPLYRLLALAAPLCLLACSTAPGGPAALSQAPAPRPSPTPFTDAAVKAEAALFGARAYAPGQFDMLAPAAIPKEGATRITVSLSRQRVWIWKGDALVGVSTMSAGTADHPTDPGTFSVLAKKRMHRSTKYSNAPMPFMQRLDKWGRAFHAGVVPGHPASHGCIRLPREVAQRLYGLTVLGTPVTIEA